MLSLLLELVLIRWLASYFPSSPSTRNFTMLACFLGLGAGYAVAERKPARRRWCLPMLALFVGGHHAFCDSDTGVGYLIFSCGG